MPNYKTHLFGGLVIYLIMFCIFIKQKPLLITSIQWLFCCLIGSLFPDIDTKSKIQKLFYFVLLLIFSFLLIHNKKQTLIFFSFIGLIPLIVRHRGIFHKTWFIILLSVAFKLILNFLQLDTYDLFISLIFFTLGALSHLYMDLGIKRMFKW